MNTSPLDRRTPIDDRMFNPFLGVLLVSSFSNAYHSQRLVGAPMPLLFVNSGVVLHGPSRSAVNSHLSSYGLYRLTQTHPEMLVNADQRVRALQGFTRASVLLALQLGVVEMDNEFRVRCVSKPKFTATGLKPLVEASTKMGTHCSRLNPAEVFIALKVGVIPCLHV